MPSVSESQSGNILSNTLRAGLELVSLKQEITLNLYVKLALPLDGYVFWVRASSISKSAMLNAMQLNSSQLNSAISTTPLPSITARGSIHYATRAQQEPDANYSLNQIILTSEVAINDLNAVSPTTMYIGDFQGVRFAFSERKMFYEQANLFHYGGTAITAVMNTQILDNAPPFDTENVIVSNSLPIWLAMNSSTPPYPYPPAQYLPLYPADLVPANLAPPYASVNIENTEALQALPIKTDCGSTIQLAQEDVTICIYGFRNFNAIDFRDYVLNQSLWFDNFGIMNMPVVIDEKLTQPETQTIAMKKKIHFHINYYQHRARDIAKIYINEVFVNYTTPVQIVGAPISAIVN